MRGWLGLLTMSCVLAACSLGSFDEFSGGPALEDAGGGSETSTPADDSGPSDASSSSDVASESGPTGPFCQTLTTQPVACADFDDGTIPTRFKTQGNVTIDGDGVAGTKGLKSVAAGDAGSSDSACITVAIGGTRKSLTIEADVKLDQLGSGDYDVVDVRYSAQHELAIHVLADALSFEEDIPPDGSVGERYQATSGKLTTTYRRLKFAIAINGAVAHAELFVDGTSVGQFDADSVTVASTTTVHFGDCTFAAARNWTLHYDNVVVYETQ